MSMQTCPNCSPLETTLTKCPKCGFPLDDENLEANKQVEEFVKNVLFGVEQRKILQTMIETEPSPENTKAIEKVTSNIDDQLRSAQEFMKTLLEVCK